MTGGYRSFRERMHQAPLPPWQERLPLAFWRGATTGSHRIDLTNLNSNRRYQLSRMSRCWPNRLDARFNRVVQCRTAAAHEQVERRLQEERLLGATVHPWHAACTRGRSISMATSTPGPALETAFIAVSQAQQQNAMVPSPTPTLEASGAGKADLSDLDAQLLVLKPLVAQPLQRRAKHWRCRLWMR